MQDVICTFLLITGSAAMFLAGLGILRMPDLYTRLSGTAKASTLAAGLLLVAAAVRFMSLEVTVRSFAIIIFLFLTTPLSAQMIGRAAYRSGVPLWNRSVRDDLKSADDTD